MTKETCDLVAEQLLNATDEDVFDAYTDADAGRTVFAGGPDWDVDVTCVNRFVSRYAAPSSGALRMLHTPWSIAHAAWPSSRR